MQTKQTRKTVKQVRLVPKGDHYVVEVVYRREASPAPVDPELFVAADLGVNVLATLVSNKLGFTPRLVNGRPLKATNQLYNKRRALLQQQLARANRFTSSPLDRLTSDAQRPCPAVPARPAVASSSGTVEEGIGTLIIGKNAFWKQGVELGHKNKGGVRADPSCMHHPSSRPTRQPWWDRGAPDRGELHQVRPASWIAIPTYDPARKEHPHFSGKRDGRWYHASGNRLLHSDVNGAYNIGRKVVPTAFDGIGIGAAAVRPRRQAV